MARPRQQTFALALVLLLCGATVVPMTATAVSADGTDDPTFESGVPTPLSQDDGQENNTTIQHEDPADAGEDGDLDDVRSWLTNRLADQLGESTVQLSQGEYEAAQRVVGDDYSDRLGQLVDVEGETDGGGGGEGGDGAGNGSENESARFEAAQENQQEFVSSVQEYRETRERYLEAKQNGNESGARRLARILDRIARDVNETGPSLRSDYQLVTNETERDLRGESRTVANITVNITEEQREIRREEFVETSLTVERRSETASFRDPLAVAGQLTTVNGSALENATVELQLGERGHRVTTNATGHFTVRLRPTVQPLGTQNATVQYLPADTSIYLGTDERVAVKVEQVTPTVTLDQAPSVTAFNESVTVTGSVTDEERSVRAVPVEIRIDGTRIGQTRTDANGEFSLTTRLPAAVPAGDQQLNASLPLRDRALSSSGVERTVDVRETNSSLTLSAARNGTERINTTGRLTTSNGTPVADQRVELQVNGSVVETVRTDKSGQYSAQITVPSSALDDGHIRLAAIYATDQTNLADAQASTVVTVDRGADQSQLSSSQWRWVVPIAVVIATAALVVGIRMRRNQEQSPDVTTDPDEDVADDPTTTPDDGTPDSPSPSGFLEGARAALEGGRHNEAVELTYGDVRRQLAVAFGVPPVRTHWEFYEACQEAGADSETIALLEQLTQAYERAAYAPDDFSESEANQLLDAVQATELPTTG